jgi:tetratricopeptide (TPR) repeat protein
MTTRKNRIAIVTAAALGSALVLGGVLYSGHSQSGLPPNPSTTAISPPIITAPSTAVPAAPATQQIITGVQADRLAKQLSAADSDARNQAASTITSMVHTDPAGAARQFAARWATALLNAHRYQELADCGQTIALVVPKEPLDMNAMETVLRTRALALVRLRKGPEALVAAKSYYNFVRLKNTPEAVDLVIQALSISPDTVGLVPAFRQEQTSATAATTKQSDAHLSRILKSISIDAAPYQSVVDSLTQEAKELHGLPYYRTLIARGNRLLMADRADEAFTYFKEAYRMCRQYYPRYFKEAQLAAAAESVARALRAQDGTVARANAFLIQEGFPEHTVATANLLRPIVTTQPTP